MSTSTVTASDRRRFTGARERGDEDRRAPNAVVEATYLKDADAIEVVFRGGMILTIPCIQVPILANIRRSKLASVTVSPAGDALSWRSLDIDIDVQGLIDALFRSGNRETVAE